MSRLMDIVGPKLSVIMEIMSLSVISNCARPKRTRLSNWISGAFRVGSDHRSRKGKDRCGGEIGCGSKAGERGGHWRREVAEGPINLVALETHDRWPCHLWCGRWWRRRNCAAIRGRGGNLLGEQAAHLFQPKFDVGNEVQNGF